MGDQYMRARTRLFLDTALLLGFVAAYRPTWTGITLHQWLSIAIVAPALVHLIVNWEWAIRIVRTFLQRLFSASRLNFVVDCTLLLATVTVTVSGFMVSPALIAPFGIHASRPLEWHLVHSWSADATILIVLLHTALHWRWLLAAIKQLVGSSSRAAAPRTAVEPNLGAAAVAATAVARSSRTTRDRSGASGRGRTRGAGTSRVGARAAKAAAERAAARRTFSVLGLSAFLGFAIFTGVGLASPLFPSTPPSVKTVAGKPVKMQTCPKTGCQASLCHADYGQSAAQFYKNSKATVKKASAKKKTKTSTTYTSATSPKHATSIAKSVEPVAPPASSATVTSKKTTAMASTPAKATVHVAAKPAAKPKKKKLMTCPHTGCQRSSCHADAGESAAKFY